MNYIDIGDAMTLYEVMRKYSDSELDAAIGSLREPEGRFCPSCQKYKSTYDDLCLECGTDT